MTTIATTMQAERVTLTAANDEGRAAREVEVAFHDLVDLLTAAYVQQAGKAAANGRG
jgi:hypothetical protein